jgi:hypothetical protein
MALRRRRYGGRLPLISGANRYIISPTGGVSRKRSNNCPLHSRRTMNYPILIAGAIVLLAFLAHTFIGSREALSIRPRPAPGEPSQEATTIERNWVQSLCAFQLVTVDLFVLAALLLVLGATELLPARREVALLAAAFFTLWGGAWLLQLLLLRRGFRDYLMLGQWAFWFVCAGLLWWGAQSL